MKLKEVFEQVVMVNLGRWLETIAAAKVRVSELETQRMELGHYQTKVQSMRDALSSQHGKGRQPSDAQAAKLLRNEQKLAEAGTKFTSARDEALTAVYQ